MSEQNQWPDQVRVAIEDRAYSLNYSEGIQCGYKPLPEEDGVRAIEIFLETSHAGYPFDLTWRTRYTDDPSTGIDFELIAPASEGGTLWQVHHDTLLGFRQDAHAIPVFVRGFFVGRKTAALRAPEETK